MNFSLSVSCFRFCFPATPNTLVAIKMGEAARQVRQTSPAWRAYTEAPQQKPPIPPTARKHRARRDRGFISAPTACGAPRVRVDCRFVMQAEELHQSYASRVGSHRCSLCSPPQHPRPSRLIPSFRCFRRAADLGIPLSERLRPAFRPFPQLSEARVLTPGIPPSLCGIPLVSRNPGRNDPRFSDRRAFFDFFPEYQGQTKRPVLLQ